MDPGLLVIVIVSSSVGAGIGSFTGIVPGIHVNTAASLMVSLTPTVSCLIAGIVEPGSVPLVIACCMFSAATVHSFVSFVPSVFIGAPDPDDALSVLPAHKLLNEGRGMVAVRASAIGSAVGAASAIVLAIPIQALMLAGLSGFMESLTLGVLLVTLVLLAVSSSRPPVTVLIILASGTLGICVMSGGIPSEGILGEGTLLFPMLTGLFGVPPLLERHEKKRARHQDDDGCDPVGPVPGIRGVGVGLMAGWFPGVTATVGATIASAFGGERRPEEFIALASSISTVTSVFALVTLSVTGSGRSGVAMAAGEILGDSLGGFCSDAFLAVLLSMVVAAGIGYAATIAFGRGMSAVYGSIPGDVLGDAVLLLIAVLVFLMTGPFGLVVLTVGAGLGMIPPALGVGRASLASCLIVPSVLNCAGIPLGLPFI